MKPSPVGWLTWRDSARGIATAMFGAFLTGAYEALQAGPMDAKAWQTVGLVSLAAGISHILRKFFTPAPAAQTLVGNRYGWIVRRTADLVLGVGTPPPDVAAYVAANSATLELLQNADGDWVICTLAYLSAAPPSKQLKDIVTNANYLAPAQPFTNGRPPVKLT